MDSNRFDSLTRAFGERRSRRVVLRGLLGLGGAAAAVTTRGAEAQWSLPVCLPDGAGGYIHRLVPKAAVPFYVSRYGAEPCASHQNVCLSNGSCAETCTDSDQCFFEGCGCSRPSAEGPAHCVPEFLPCGGQTCESTADCPHGHQCQECSEGSYHCEILCR